LSWIATTYLGAKQLRKVDVEKWSGELFEAFVAGCWLLYWTEDILYWVAKPTVHKDPTSNIRRLHNDAGPAIESDIENLYYIRGVMVPAFVVVRPDWITAKHIAEEENAEVRRVMLERFGIERYLTEGNFKLLHKDNWGTLYQEQRSDGQEPLTLVRVVNSTPESDGSFKEYTLTVRPDCAPMFGDGRPPGRHQRPTALNAIASTFGMVGEEYARVGAQS
jgi:hypothetical protein